MKKHNSIIIKGIKKISNYNITYEYTYPQHLRKLFSDKKFFVKYSKKIKNIPKGILLIPLLSSICPIAWVNNMDIFVDEIDKNFIESMQIIKENFNKLYPGIDFKGSIYAKNIYEYRTISNRSATLFSGGVDSLSTYIDIQNEKPYLITIGGADIQLKEINAWRKVTLDNTEFGKAHNLSNFFIESNFRIFFNEAILNLYYNKYIDNWWGNIHHGLGLIGLVAPLTYKYKISKLYIPATHTRKFKNSWGSHPDIDNNIRWFGLEVIHQGYKYSRQEKLIKISNYIKKNKVNLQIRSCYMSSNGDNCCICEKCCRTIIGIKLVGLDPNKYGFRIDKSIYDYIENKFKNREWYLGKDEVFMWEDIQNHINLERYKNEIDLYKFLKWLKKSNIKEFSKSKKFNIKNHFMKILLFFPYPIYRIIRVIWKKLKLIIY